MNRRGLGERPWRVVEDVTGGSVLQWIGAADGKQDEGSPLERLDTDELQLLEDVRVETGYDPYDSGVFSVEGSAFYSRSHGKNEAFARRQRGR